MKTAIITGAYGAIGKAISSQLAGMGFSVVLVGRNNNKLTETVNELKAKTGNDRIQLAEVDLSMEKEIIRFAEQWKGSLHLLINNAAATPPKRCETMAGIEVQFATNVLGYFWMMKHFAPMLGQEVSSRIVNVASYWAGGLDFNDLEFKGRKYDNNLAYRQSKQANRMLTVAFAKRLQPYGISVNACHPGDVNSKLSNSMGFGGHETPDEGAGTPVWLATNAEVKHLTGKYFEHRRLTRCSFSEDEEAVERLWKLCDGY